MPYMASGIWDHLKVKMTFRSGPKGQNDLYII